MARSLKTRLDQRGRNYDAKARMPFARPRPGDFRAKVGGGGASMPDPARDHVGEGRRRVGRVETWPGPQSKGPALWALHEPVDFPAPIYGRYPQGFLLWALRAIRCGAHEVLHVCSGGLEKGQGMRIDLRQDARPDLRADGCRLPFRDGAFAGVLIDPPYTEGYSRDLYGVEYPKPTALLAEAARVVRPCGRIGFLHFSVPFPPAGAAFERVWGVTTGCGYQIRAFSVFRREQDALFPEET